MSETTRERKPRAKAAPKTKEAKRAAWRAYYKKNKVKYLGWARGWRAGMKVTPEEFNKKWEALAKEILAGVPKAPATVQLPGLVLLAGNNSIGSEQRRYQGQNARARPMDQSQSVESILHRDRDAAPGQTPFQVNSWSLLSFLPPAKARLFCQAGTALGRCVAQ